MIPLSDAVLVGAVTAVLTVFVFFQLREFFKILKVEYEYMHHPRFIQYSPARACAGPHSWKTVKLAFRGLPFGDYGICRECGTVLNHPEVMCSDEVLAHVKEAETKELEAREAAEIAEKRLESEFMRHMEIFVSKMFYDFGLEGVFSQSNPMRYRLLEQVNYAYCQSIKKIRDEAAAQAELNCRYENWPSKVRGSA